MRTIRRTFALHPQKFGGIDLNRSLSQLSYRPIYEAVLFPARCYDPENIDIIAAFGTFVKAFFQIPAQIGSARGSLVLHAQLVAADDLSLVGSGGGGVALQRDQAGVDRVDDPLGIREEILVELVRRGDPVARADDDGRRIQITECGSVYFIYYYNT